MIIFLDVHLARMREHLQIPLIVSLKDIQISDSSGGNRSPDMDVITPPPGPESLFG